MWMWCFINFDLSKVMQIKNTCNWKCEHLQDANELLPTFIHVWRMSFILGMVYHGYETKSVMK